MREDSRLYYLNVKFSTTNKVAQSEIIYTSQALYILYNSYPSSLILWSLLMLNHVWRISRLQILPKNVNFRVYNFTA